MGKFEDLKGKTFGEWNVIKLDEELMEQRKKEGKCRKTYWICKCSCGNIKSVSSGDLKSGKTLSCGCLYANRNIYDLSKEYGIGYDKKGKCFYFDKEDYNLIKRYYWYINIDGYAITHTEQNKGFILMHRLVKNVPKDCVIDHKNRNRNDNRKENLLVCRQLENVRNIPTRKDNKSGCNGVYKRHNGRWEAYINVNKKRIYLGTYDIYEEAVKVRKEAELKYWGEIIDR